MCRFWADRASFKTMDAEAGEMTKKLRAGAGEKAQRLRALAALQRS